MQDVSLPRQYFDSLLLLLLGWLNDETSSLDIFKHINQQLIMLYNVLGKLSDTDIRALAADLEGHGMFDEVIKDLNCQIGLFWNRISMVYQQRPSSLRVHETAKPHVIGS